MITSIIFSEKKTEGLGSMPVYILLLQPWRAQRGRVLPLSQRWPKKNTKVEPCICRKHNGRATKNLPKVFYFCILGARSVDLSYHWVSADLKNTKVEPCICSKHNGRATKNLQKVFFVFLFPKTRTPIPFFVYVKLLISLLNGSLFRLGENFPVRGSPERRGKIFSAVPSPFI